MLYYTFTHEKSTPTDQIGIELEFSKLHTFRLSCIGAMCLIFGVPSIGLPLC